MIGILTCTGSNISIDDSKKLGIYELSLRITTFGKDYREFRELTTEEIYENIKKGDVPKTATPSLSDVVDTIEQMKADGITEILGLTISAELSSTASMVIMVCKEQNMKLSFVDCFTSLYVEQYYVQKAKEMVDKGYEIERIVNKLEEAIKYADTIMLPDGLDYFVKGGRVSAIKGKLGSVLGIKPVLVINANTGGHIDFYKKCRTRSKAYAEMLNLALKEAENHDIIVYVSDALLEEESDKIIEMLKEKNIKYKKDIVSGVFACHVGIKSIVIQVVKTIDVD